jgi:hypothetical protein
MKQLRSLILIYCCFSTVNLFAQSPQFIETDLLKSFKRINYWNEKSHIDTTGNITLGDSLADANTGFAKRLKYYTEKYPFTINQKFTALVADNLDVSSSDDGLFRIYSWDTWTGGTMHFFESVFQYKWKNRTYSILDTPKTEGDSRVNYTKLYTFKANNTTYYLSIYLFIESSRYAGQGIQIFSIINGKLNANTKLIKTKTGLHGQISYEYDFGSVVDIPFEKRPSIYFESKTQTIYIPLVESNGKVTHQYITYKFNGKYFEKVKF